MSERIKKYEKANCFAISMSYSHMILGELIEKLGGNLIQGDPEWIVESVNSCERASPFDLAFADSPDSTTAALSGHVGTGPR